MRMSVVLLVLGVSAALARTPWDFVVSNNRFAASVYKAHSLNAEGNFLLSPLSLDTVLTLTQWGAMGATAEELRKCLLLPEDKAEVASTLQAHLPTLEMDQPYTLRTANKIYIKDDYKLKDEFRNASQDVFGCELESVDFASTEEAATKMNLWVEKRTDGRIRQLVDSEALGNNTRALLLNTVLFRGRWASPFPKLFTFKEDFFEAADRGVQVDMMHDFGGNYNFFDCPLLEAKFLEIPFEGEGVTMTIVLPNAKDGLHKVEQRMDLVLETNNFSRETVDLSLPRFRVESRVDFKEVLKTLGVSKAFEDGEADLSGIAGDPGDLFVSEVVQKSFVDVDESGVEAASATSVIILFNRSGIPSKEFVVNRPFLFFIKVKGLVVFVGRVLTPLSNEIK